METTTSFDLNQTIQRWRENLGQSPAFRAENLDELEAHLRDSIMALQMRDLSAEEAFSIATRRLGSQHVLGTEFEKVNRKTIWLDRFLWMIIGIQLWLALSIVYSTTQVIVQAVLYWTVEGRAGVSELGLDLKVKFLPPALLALVLFLGWKLLQRADRTALDVFSGLLRKPLKLAIELILVTVCFGLLADSVQYYWIGPTFYKTPPSLPYTAILYRVNSLLPSVAAAALTWVLARKRPRIGAT